MASPDAPAYTLLGSDPSAANPAAAAPQPQDAPAYTLLGSDPTATAPSPRAATPKPQDFTYTIAGKTLQTPTKLSDSDIEGLNAQFLARTPDQATIDNASLLGDTWKAVKNGAAKVGFAFATDAQNNAAQPSIYGEGGPTDSTGLNKDLLNPLSDEQKSNLKAAASFFNAYRNNPENMSVGANMSSGAALQSAHNFALHALGSLGENAIPMAAAVVTRNPALPFLLADRADADATYADTGNKTAAETAGLISGVGQALPVPFMKGANGLLPTLLRGTAGNAISGELAGALGHVPSAIISGNPADALPSRDDLITSGLTGAALGGPLGAAFHFMPHTQSPQDTLSAIGTRQAIDAAGDPEAQAQNGADDRLAASIGNQADSLGITLGNNVKYGSPKSDQAVLDNVHNDLASSVNAHAAVLSDLLDPAQATSQDDFDDRTQAQGTLRDMRNKLKGTASPDDIQNLQNLVGHTTEGQQLIDLARQSNTLTNLFKTGTKGGLSQYTDYLNPLGRGGSETGLSAFLGNGGIKTAELLAAIHTGGVSVPIQLGLFGAGRAIDAITGLRSPIARFVSDNAGDAQPLDTSSAQSSLLQDKFNADAAAIAQQRAADAAAQQAQARALQLRSQNFADNNPGAPPTDGEKAPFLRRVYNQTGLLPQDQAAGVFELNRLGKITRSEFENFFGDPHSLQEGNVGNYISDALWHMAQTGQLPRDPAWRGDPAGASLSTDPTQVGNISNSGVVPQDAPVPQAAPVRNQAAYDAAATGNQDRITAAQGRVAASPHSPAAKQAINDAIAAISRTNNRQDAAAIRDNVTQALVDPAAQATARQEIDPLVAQIRHATPEAAEAVRTKLNKAPVNDQVQQQQQSSNAPWLHGSDTPLTTDMMQRGRSMWLTRNAGVAKNVGRIVHQVDIRPGDGADITSEVAARAKDRLGQQRAAYDISQEMQWHNPDIKYLDWQSPDGPIRIVQNQGRDVLGIGRYIQGSPSAAQPFLRKALNAVSKTEAPLPPQADAVLGYHAKVLANDPSLQTINNTFGEDAPRFASLLRSLELGHSHSDALEMALNKWADWIDAGRP